jgi:hypothetical protein
VGGRFLAFILIGLIFERISGERHRRQREQEFFVGGVEKKPLVSGVAEFYTKREDPIVHPTPSPALPWISGRDPLLVVSIVTAGKNTPN